MLMVEVFNYRLQGSRFKFWWRHNGIVFMTQSWVQVQVKHNVRGFMAYIISSARNHWEWILQMANWLNGCRTRKVHVLETTNLTISCMHEVCVIYYGTMPLYHSVLQPLRYLLWRKMDKTGIIWLIAWNHLRGSCNIWLIYA